jgi:hypothetical protein
MRQHIAGATTDVEYSIARLRLEIFADKLGKIEPSRHW